MTYIIISATATTKPCVVYTKAMRFYVEQCARSLLVSKLLLFIQ